MHLSYLVSTCYKSWILVKYVFPTTALHLQSNLLMTMIRLLYVTKTKHHACPQVTLSKRAADSLALASAFGKENGANNNRNNNNNNNNNWAGPWNSPEVKTCVLFWMCDILLSWFFSPPRGYLMMAAGFCGMFSGTAFPDPRRRGAFKVPAVDVAAGHVPKLPWVCCSGACARCDVLWQRQRCSNARRQKTCCSFLGGTFGFFGCTFLEMMDWTASCWILPASHLINTSPCQASTGFQSCLHVIFELVFVSFWCPRHFIFHSFTFPIPWGMCHCLFMT